MNEFARIVDIIKAAGTIGYDGVLVLYAILAYKLLDRWAAPLIKALTDCARAFGELRGELRGSVRDTPPRETPLPPPSRKDPR
jgi:hypothetical protein